MTRLEQASYLYSASIRPTRPLALRRPPRGPVCLIGPTWRSNTPTHVERPAALGDQQQSGIRGQVRVVGV